MSPTPFTWALAALLAPAAVALLLVIVPPLRRAGLPAAVLSIAAAGLACLAALGCVLRLVAGAPAGTLAEPWLVIAGQGLGVVGVHLDGVSASMLAVVSAVALCVQIFSLGYMASEQRPAFGRYFAYQSLFLFSMNALVLAPDLLQLFFGWELVGVSSYLLIGFWWQKPSAARAATKAFWFTKLADMGFLGALLLLLSATGGFSWSAELAPGVALAVTALLFVAVVGKSAQFPLHVWLPDAMEGPTPVSALLHAATMVAAGVFLLVRAEPLFAQAEGTRLVMMYVGGGTALMAAVLATTQTDIKRVLAYSTCSQLGFMVAALGAGAWTAGYFHLTTHAAFKALLFLAAGAVIHAVHSNELSDMGGLWRRMPLTATTFCLGALALAGLPGLSGFFSKDLVLEAVAGAGQPLVLAALLLTTGLTSFYMGRVLVLAFFGPRGPRAEHAHDPGLSMSAPLVLLAIPAAGLGLLGHHLAELWRAPYTFHLGGVGLVAVALSLGGLAAAYLQYAARRLPASWARLGEPVVRATRAALVDRAFVRLHAALLAAPARLVGWIDRYVIDGLMNLFGDALLSTGGQLRRVQTGRAHDYLLAVAVAVVLLAAWGMK